MKDFLAPILRQIRLLWARLDRVGVHRWGVVSQVSPLLVALDWATDENDAPVSVPAVSTVAGLALGDRVFCVEQHLRVTVIGRAV